MIVHLVLGAHESWVSRDKKIGTHLVHITQSLQTAAKNTLQKPLINYMILGKSFCFSELLLHLENENNHSLPHQVVVKFRWDKCERPVETGKSSINIQSFSPIYVLFVRENYFWLNIFVDSFNKGLLRACYVPDNGFCVENTEEIKEILTLKNYLVCEVGWEA